MARQQRSHSDIQGFTLIEVLVAMVIFSIASLGTASVLTNTMRANMMAHHRSFATAFAQDKIEEVRASGTGACTGGTASQGSISFSLACGTAAGPNGSYECDRDRNLGGSFESKRPVTAPYITLRQVS